MVSSSFCMEIFALDMIIELFLKVYLYLKENI
jgi:hypothetical protein